MKRADIQVRLDHTGKEMAMGREKRSVLSIVKTAKYHMPYIGNVLAVTLGLLALLYLLLLQRLMEATAGEDPALVKNLVAALTIAALAVGSLITLVALLQAHRVAGIHIKLKATFDRIKDGELDAQLKFRESDRLNDVEDSFNQMMEAVRARIPTEDASSESKPEDTPSETE
jgi:methyl-accepting chemotaxis protein